MLNHEPCLCGAYDCPKCRPLSWSQDLDPEDRERIARRNGINRRIICAVADIPAAAEAFNAGMSRADDDRARGEPDGHDMYLADEHERAMQGARY